MEKNNRLKTIFLIVLGLFLFISIFYFIDIKQVIEALKNLSVLGVILAIIFALFSLFLEFIRWEIYIRAIGIKISKFKSFLIYFSGIALGMAPSKTGELVRYYLLKKEGANYSKTMPIHFITNFTNLFIVLIFISPLLYSLGKINLLTIWLILLIIPYIFLRKQSNLLYILNILRKIKNLKAYNSIEHSIISSKKLLDDRVTFESILVGTITYFVLFLTFYFLGIDILPDADLLTIFILYSIFLLSLIIGIISMIPGGFGSIELSGIALMSMYISPGDAAALMLIMRIITYWMNCIIGFACMMKYKNYSKTSS